MEKYIPVPGQRVEIDEVGEGTVISVSGENEVEVAVSELETYRVSADHLHQQ